MNDNFWLITFYIMQIDVLEVDGVYYGTEFFFFVPSIAFI